MARTRKYFERWLDQSLASERRLILELLKDGKIPDFENRIFLFQYIRRLEAIVAENCAGPGDVSNDGLNEWTKARSEGVGTSSYL
jgi:hypothetical protein